MEPASHFFYSHRLKLQFWDWGTPGKPVVILVHGSRDHARSWDAVARTLREDYHVYAIDLRGHGNSAWGTGAARLNANRANSDARRGTMTRKVVAAALLILPSALFVISCSRPPEQQFLTQFFRAARGRDNTTVGRMSAVEIDPRTQGTVEDFSIENIGAETRSPLTFKPLFEAEAKAARRGIWNATAGERGTRVSERYRIPKSSKSK